MSNDVINWLLEDNNPAMKYRTMTEILGESADKEPVIAWLNKSLPDDWMERKGLWSVYYLTAFAECGLRFEDIPLKKDKIINFGNENPFVYGCGDYMRLRALVRLGLGNELEVADIISKLSDKQLPDGGFLCLHRIDKLKYVPKSCVKANMLALLFCAECKKQGIKNDIEKPLLDYFWKHNLFYKSDDHKTLMLNAREGWRTIDTFYPFEVMRVGLQNIVESFCALGYGNDPRLQEAWNILNEKQDPDAKYILNGALTKSYLPKERVGKPSKWVTFYALLAQKERDNHAKSR
ncbi:MAG TPA: hypothetical protein DEP23_11105 [Ruminococcaceae bacterium]|nr:hypothetical protein [Oscillospiraceae bacterium]